MILMDETCSSEIISFILGKKKINQKTREKAILHIIDGLAVIIAGSRTSCAKKLCEYVKHQTNVKTSSLIGFKQRSTPSFAALVNGTSGHADDYDDTQLASSHDRTYGLLTHPTIPVLASTLAIGEQVSCSGLEFINAFISGFEVECKIAESIYPQHYRKGFHTTGTIGTFGSFTSSSILQGLNEEELRYGLSISSSLASGIRVNFGTMTKPLHAGRAASNGIIASSLGKMRFTADLNGLDGKWGFYSVMGGGYDKEKIIGKLGNPYSIMVPGATFKMYPCGSLGQPSMDAMLEIVKEHDLSPKDFIEVKLFAGPNILEPLRYTNPVNELQAKFSLQFGLSCILLRRKAGLREYTDEFVNKPEVREMMRRIKTIHDPVIAEMGTEKMRSRVEVILKNGKLIKKTAEDARGTPEKPLTEEDIYEKFLECSSFVYSKDQAENLFDSIKKIGKLKDINEFTGFFSQYS
jgi:2-methylcitrate dehydratase PrpD